MNRLLLGLVLGTTLSASIIGEVGAQVVDPAVIGVSAAKISIGALAGGVAEDEKDVSKTKRRGNNGWGNGGDDGINSPKIPGGFKKVGDSDGSAGIRGGGRTKGAR